MFRRVDQQTTPVRFYFNGIEVTGAAGDSIAAALLAAGYLSFGHHPISGAARGPYCLMGTCHECAVVLHSTTAQACQVPIVEGLVVRSCR